jgi:hypothetical protein
VNPSTNTPLFLHFILAFPQLIGVSLRGGEASLSLLPLPTEKGVRGMGIILGTMPSLLTMTLERGMEVCRPLLKYFPFFGDSYRRCG